MDSKTGFNDWAKQEALYSLPGDSANDTIFHSGSSTQHAPTKRQRNERDFVKLKDATSEDAHHHDDDPNKNRRSIKSIWQNFAASTTLHGVGFFQETDINVIGKIVWSALFLGMLTSLGYVLISLLLRYREYPITSVWNLRHVASMDAPTVTICPVTQYDINKLKEAPKYIQEFYIFKNWTLDYMDEIQDSNMTQHSIVDSFGFSKEDMIVYASLEFGSRKLVEGADVLTRRVFNERLCFTFNDFRDEWQINKVTKTHNLQIYMDLRKEDNTNLIHFGMFLYIHKKGTSMLRSIPIMIPPGMSHYVLFRQTEYTFLPLPYKSLGDSDCVDLTDGDFVNPLLNHPIYTLDNCLVELKEKMMARMCGCAEKDYIHHLKTKECTLYDMLTCVWSLDFEFNQNLSESISYDRYGCPYPCNSTVIETSSSTLQFYPTFLPNATYDDVDHIHLIIQPKTTSIDVIEHVPELTLIDILATVGGYMGFFLGASLLTVAEFAQVLIASLKYFLWNKQNQSTATKQ